LSKKLPDIDTWFLPPGDFSTGAVDLGTLSKAGKISNVSLLDGTYFTLVIVQADSDGDGIINFIDTDDDNDGILDVDEDISPIWACTRQPENTICR
jgi:hypothetical protein